MIIYTTFMIYLVRKEKGFGISTVTPVMVFNTKLRQEVLYLLCPAPVWLIGQTHS